MASALTGCLGIEDRREPLDATEYADRLFELTNQQRVAEDMPTLNWVDCIVEDAAQPRADAIPVDGDLEHQTLVAACHEGASAAENLSRSGETPEQIVERWMASPGHRANILNREFVDVGIACAALEDIGDLPMGQQPVMACSQVFEGP
jgi:uncharacterized protein YkwD